MRKFTLIIAIVFSGMLMQAQELNKNAKMLKSYSDGAYEYNDIKDAAIKEWDDDHQMIVFTINQQADALFDVVDEYNKPNYDKNIMLNAMEQWGELRGDRWKGDWVMVLFSYKNQLEAKSAY